MQHSVGVRARVWARTTSRTWGAMGSAIAGELRLVLVFEVDGESYGVDAERVQEIVRAVAVARLPAAPRVVLGLFNLRGTAVSLIDLRARFGLPARPLAPSDVFLVLRGTSRPLAVRAESVREMAKVDSATFVPMQMTAPRAAYAAGTALTHEGLLVICEVERFLDEAERLTLDAALRDAAEVGA